MLGITKDEGVSPDLLGTDELRWLSVRVAGAEEQPRMLMVSVPYALRAEEAVRLAGSPASDFVRKQDLPDAVRETLDGARVDPARTKQQSAAGAVSPLAASPPTTFSGNLTTQIVLVQQLGTGVALVATASGVGVSGISSGSAGVGVNGSSASATGIGVNGVNTSSATSGNPVGVRGSTASTTGVGVAGFSTAAGGIGVDGFGTSTTGNTIGVQAPPPVRPVSE
jgi:hypothetical protein